MLIDLKNILNSYSNDELQNMSFWINSSFSVDAIILDSNSIDLITADAEVRVNNFITKGGKLC